MKKALSLVVALGFVAATAATAAHATSTPVVKNVSTVPVRVCVADQDCPDDAVTLTAGQQLQHRPIGLARAIWIPQGWRAVVTTGNDRVDRSGPTVAALPRCDCTQTVRMVEVKAAPAEEATSTAMPTARPVDRTGPPAVDPAPEVRETEQPFVARKAKATAMPPATADRTQATPETEAASEKSPSTSPGTNPERRYGEAKLGQSASGLPWLSGVWSGGRFTPGAIDSFGAWRGRPVDLVTAYSRHDSYQAMVDESWSIDVWEGVPGRLNFGLALLPDSGEGSLDSIAQGEQDWVWRGVAQSLEDAGRGDSIVRIGWEANLPDWRWGASVDNAGAFKRAFRQVAQVLRATAPDLVIDFGINCGSGLAGSSDRLAALTELYPGDDVVDIIHCDVYDWWQTKVQGSDAGPLSHPTSGVGLADLATFARRHDKLMGVGEWGLAAPHNGNGGGDNPAFIEAMHRFITDNLDVFAYECYFDEPDAYIESSLTAGGQNSVAAETYRLLW